MTTQIPKPFMEDTERRTICKKICFGHYVAWNDRTDEYFIPTCLL